MKSNAYRTESIDRHISDELDPDVIAGQAKFSKGFLLSYDFMILGISNKYFWRCPTRGMVDFYNRNVTNKHLDIGVGTGYFLDKCTFPTNDPEISLADLNTNSLNWVYRRLSRYPRVRMYQRNALEPLNMAEKFDSIAVCYLLHCIPGPIEEKADTVFKNLGECLAPGGTIFGVTLLRDIGDQYAPSKYLMRFHRRLKAFGNAEDTEAGLRKALTRNFSSYDLDIVGCAAMFRGKR